MTKLIKLEISEVLQSIPMWAKMDGREAIVRDFRFEDFTDAFAFMTRCAIKAQIMDHHPEWFNCYNSVVVMLTTHDADGVTALDLEMAVFMDDVAGQYFSNTIM